MIEKPSYLQNTMFKEAEARYRKTLDSDLSLISLTLHPDGESGLFVDADGSAYDFAVHYDSSEIVFLGNEAETSYFNDYALGYLATEGVEPPSRMDAYSFMIGLANTRTDAAKKGQCGRGWEPGPGGKCARTKGERAKRAGIAVGGALAGAALGSAISNLKSPKKKSLAPSENAFPGTRERKVEQVGDQPTKRSAAGQQTVEVKGERQEKPASEQTVEATATKSPEKIKPVFENMKESLNKGVRKEKAAKKKKEEKASQQTVEVKARKA